MKKKLFLGGLIVALAGFVSSYSLSAIEPASSLGHRYLLSDGSIRLVDNRDLPGLIGALNVTFQKTHEQTRFALISGDDGTAMAALTFDAVPVAVLGGEFTAAGLTAMRKLVGTEPLAVRIAHASGASGAALSPAAIVVNRTNPLAALTVDKFARIFCVGGPKSDITSWGQLGLKGKWAQLAIRTCGLPESDAYPSDDPGMGAYLMAKVVPGLHFAHRYETFEHYADVLERVRSDPASIGIVALNRVTAEVKIIAVSADEWSNLSSGSATDIGGARYSLDRPIYLYLRRLSGQPLDSLAVEYARCALSADGQQAIGAQSAHCIPLNSAERRLELNKLP